MDATRFDVIAKHVAGRRLSRRRAFTQGGSGLVSGALATLGMGHTAAQDATPATQEGADGEKTTFLFVQSFQAGSIIPKPGVDGTYTVTLEGGLGQTVYFSDRPDRIAGAAPTPQFLEGFGFPADNPPNAALVVETAPGETDVAVVELFAPLYVPVTQGVTYDVKVLADWEASTELGFTEAPTDLAALAPTFGAAHLFIDDCADGTVTCSTGNTHYPCPNNNVCGTFGPQGYCYSYSGLSCFPCEPYMHLNPGARQVYVYWEKKCNATFDTCHSATNGNGCTANL